MTHLAIRHLLPRAIRAPLWGDRERWGLVVDEQDPCWREWSATYTDFYLANQREGIGTRVNDAGYRVMSSIDLDDKRVLEIGAGDIRHLPHWRGQPAEYLLADVSTAMMAFARERLTAVGVNHRTLLVERNQALPLADASVDVIVSFYSLEHLYPLRPYLDEMRRVLKPGGTLIGAIPAEGGLAWGGGADAHLPALVQEKHPDRSGQDHLLGTSQLRRPGHRRTGSGLPAPIHRALAAALGAGAGPQSHHPLSVSQTGRVSGVG